MAKFRKQKKPKSKIAKPARDTTEADAKLKDERIMPILANLKSANFRDRVVAMGAVNSMIDDPKIRGMLLKEKLLQIILSHSLSDLSQEIVSEGFGLLRNVIIEEGRDPAVYLFRQNIFVTIKTTLDKLSRVWQESEKLTKLGDQDRSIVREFIENVIGLSSGLVLADDAIYDAFIEQVFEPALPFLVELLSASSALIVDAVLELLYLMSEEEKAVALMVNGGVPAKVEALAVKSATSTVYRIGILYNLMEVTQQGSLKDLMAVLEQLYSNIKDYDFAKVVPTPPDISTEPKKLKDAVLEAAKVRSEINATQVGFEIFASIMESWSHAAEQSDEMVEFVVTQLAPLAARALAFPNYALRACSTLNNIGWTLNLLEVDWKLLAEQIWAYLPGLLQNQEDTATLASAIGLLASISACCNGQVPLSSNDISQLVDACVALRPAEINLAFEETRDFMHLVQALVPFLCSVGASSTDLSICAKASDTIFAVLETPTLIPAEVLVECINGLFDLFGDNEAPNNSIYIANGLNAKLKQGKPEFKRALKAIDKAKQPALKEQVDETLLNLDRFIAYKQESLPA